MNFFAGLYNQKLVENRRNILFWEDYINKLKSLHFDVYAEKLKVPALVPVGSRMFFRGELKHTNEVTVALGADYFVKCSLKQAEVLRLHRIKGAQEKLEMFENERQYLENQLSLSNEAVHKEQGKDIVEFHTEEEDREWREQHRENVSKYMQNKNIPVEQENKNADEISDQELWNRLEELELQEELENELLSMKEDQTESENKNSDFIKETFIEIFSNKEDISNQEVRKENEATHAQPKTAGIISKTEEKAVTFTTENENVQSSPKIDLLQQVIDKQNELCERLQELRNKDRGQSKTEIELIKKLDEMDELDELEDDMERLEDLIEEENQTSEEELPSDTASSKTKLNRNVSFADEDESKTLQIAFTHTVTKPCEEPYDIKKGIKKPSDIYHAFPNSFRDTVSILKRSKYESANVVKELSMSLSNVQIESKHVSEDLTQDIVDKEVPRTIVIKDIVERNDSNDVKLESKSRPTSLFKMRRQQQNK